MTTVTAEAESDSVRQLLPAALITDLKARDAPDETKVVQVLGYAAQGDGGDAWFRWDDDSTDTDDSTSGVSNVTVINPTSNTGAGRWLVLDPTNRGGYPTADSGSNRDLTTADRTRYIRMTSGSANTVTLSAAVLAALPARAEISGIQAGAGQTTITAGPGVTLNATPGLKTRAQYSAWTIKKVSDTEADVIGDLTA